MTDLGQIPERVAENTSAGLAILTSPANNTAPRANGDKRELTPKRKQTTLYSLVNELTKEDSQIGGDHYAGPGFEDDRGVPTVDAHLQQVGAESFRKFEQGVITLDSQLRNFANAARQLASSVGVLSSAYLLRERLPQILHIFHENAADLFPLKISHKDLTRFQHLPVRRPTKLNKKTLQLRRPVDPESLDPEAFPEQVKNLDNDLTIFLESLSEFPEFTMDRTANASLLAFQGDLKYWASCLSQYKGQFRTPAVQRYLHDLSSELGDHIDSMTASLTRLIEVGVPTVRIAQQHGATNLLNLSTIATFFSAVTASTLQFSVNQKSGVAANAVNAFWFTSLVFSIGRFFIILPAAVNSLLGLTWKQAMYRSPRRLVPWWVEIWIRRSPLVFLVLSVACFSAGLVLFSYSSGQHPVTSIITTIFSAFSSVGLVAVSAWFASERYVSNRHKGGKWLTDVLDDLSEKFFSVLGIRWMERVLPEKWKAGTAQIVKALRWASMMAARVRSSAMDTFATQDSTGVRSNSSSHRTQQTRPTSLATFFDPNSSLVSDPSHHTESPITPTIQIFDTSGQPRTPARSTLANAVRNAMILHRANSVVESISNSKSTFVMPRRSRVAGLLHKLKNMVPTQEIAAHGGSVRHMQFSPDGKFFATSSWDRTSVIFNVGNPYTEHRVLLHLSNGYVDQVAWSPNGSMVMTKLSRAVRVWTQDGVCRKTIERDRRIQSIAWLPGGEAFLSVEENEIVKMDINGNVVDTYDFDRMLLHDVAVTSDAQRIFAVGTVVRSADGLRPSHSKYEKQIIAYNLEQKVVESRVPVLYDIRDITISRDDQDILVSCHSKAPPQLWKVELVEQLLETGDAHSTAIAQLSLRHTYMPKAPVDFAGPSYFGGKDDQLIICAGKSGDIHLWDRDSGALLHHTKAQLVGGDLTAVAWNHAADPFMFATGSHDGAVRIWTTATGSQQESPLSEVRVSTPRTETRVSPLRPNQTPTSPSSLSPEYRHESITSSMIR